MNSNIAFFEESSSDSSIYEFNTSSSSCSSSSSSSTDEETTKRARIENYIEIIRQYTDIEFRRHFRLTRNASEKLIELYKSENQNDCRGRPEIDLDIKIYMTIWFLANTETYRQISDRFNMTKSSVFRILHSVIKWIVIKSGNYIKWPSATEMQENQQKFKNVKSFPRVIGAIDGSHIAINCPKNNKDSYSNRKGYYSILIQAIVGPNRTFMDIHCGEPGSMHDARLFRKSAFYTEICNRPDLIIPRGVLLGDSAYPSTNYMVTPFNDFGNLNDKQRRFNYLHSATRIVVEHAFGLLKSRFRRLRFFESPDIGFITNCVIASCVLHNICITENDADSEEHEPEDEINLVETEEQQIQPADGHHEENNAREEIFRELDNNNLLNR